MMEYFAVFISFLLTFLCYIYFYKMLNDSEIKIRKISKVNIIIIVIFAIISAFLSIKGFVITYLLFSITSSVFLIYRVHNEKLKKVIYYYSIIYVVTVLADALMPLFLNNNLIFNFSKYYQNFFIRSLLIVPVFTLVFLFCKIKVVKKFLKNFYIKLFCEFRLKKFHVLVAFIIICLILILFLLNAFSSSSHIEHLIIISSILLMMIITVILLILVYKHFQIEECNNKIISENQFILGFMKYEKTFKHNLVNNLIGLKVNADKKTKILIDELIHDYKHDYKNIANINDLPNGIQNIFYEKMYQRSAQSVNTIVNNTVESDIYELLSPKNYNLFCTSVGILVDNSFEAIEDCENKIIYIDISENKKELIFIIKNSFNNLIDLEKIGTVNYTTKLTGQGIGLNFLNQKKNIRTRSEIINNLFVVEMSINKIANKKK